MIAQFRPVMAVAAIPIMGILASLVVLSIADAVVGPRTSPSVADRTAEFSLPDGKKILSPSETMPYLSTPDERRVLVLPGGGTPVLLQSDQTIAPPADRAPVALPPGEAAGGREAPDRCFWHSVIPGLETLLTPLCRGQGFAGILLRVSSGALALALAPLILFALAAAVCGQNRARLARVFPKLVPVIVFAVFLNVLVQGLLVMAMLRMVTWGSLRFWPAAGEVIVLATAAFILFSTVRGLLQSAVPASGDPVLAEAAPGLWDLVGETAARLGAPRPDNIVLGLEPGFWVVNGTVSAGIAAPRMLRGRTLYLSTPLLRVLDRGELSAIIGHELGHYRGSDTEYTARFVPIYGALTGAQFGIARVAASPFGEIAYVQVIAWVLNLPLRALVDVISLCFQRNVSAIARQREFAADAAAIEVAPPTAFARALVKTSLYFDLWNQLYWVHLALSLEGRKGAANPAASFAAAAHLYCDAETAARMDQTVLAETIEHPFDTHPSNIARIQQVGVDPAAIRAGEIARAPARGVGLELVPGLDEIETRQDAGMIASHDEFSTREVQGHAGEKRGAMALQAIFDASYELLAPFVIAAPDPAGAFRRVLHVAGETESRFDSLAFAAVCTGLRAIPPLDETLAVLDRELGAEGRKQVLQYLAQLSDGLAADATGPGGPDALARLVRHFEKPPPGPTEAYAAVRAGKSLLDASRRSR